MKQHLPTIVAFVLFALSLTLALFITANQNVSHNKPNADDVEIIIKKTELQQIEPKPKQTESFFVEISMALKNKLKANKQYAFAVIDSYEIEIGDYWREVLNKFEYFEYYKAFPEAFIRRLIFMPTFTGNKELSEENELEEKPAVYPDYDYRSFKYRASLVPNTIDFLKSSIDFICCRLKYCLIF